MGNMGYVRFENTHRDLQDCYDHFDDEDLSDTEEEARKDLVELCRQIADDYGDDDGGE